MNTPKLSFRMVSIDDARSAHEWFRVDSGRDTLLLMGNAEHEITASTMKSEKAVFQELMELEREAKQVTRAICVDETLIGLVWIELIESHTVPAPSIHIMIGDIDYRGQGYGRKSLMWGIEFAKKTLGVNRVHSRHLVSNHTIADLMNKLGFESTGGSYLDENGLEWQNVFLSLKA